MRLGERYRLVRQIGSGAMAAVWEAEHLALQTSVAVKLVVTEGPQADRLAARFLEEARTAAQVKHRHVVEILDFGSQDDGQPFMVMELLRGRSLEEALYGERPISVGQAITHLLETLSGLGAVHDAGLIHRDLKPANIFLAEDADGAFAKLLDFGLSRTVGATTEGGRREIAGTPEYMSPEQAAGRVDLDRTTDLYSIGVILYQILAGVLPYDAMPTRELLDAVKVGEPPPLRDRCPWIGEELESITLRAMAKEPSDRFQSARAMRESISEAVREDPALGREVAQSVGQRPRSLATAAMTIEPPIDASRPTIDAAEPPSPETPPLPVRRLGRWIALSAGAGLVAAGLLGLWSARSADQADADRPAVRGPTAPRAAEPEPVSPAEPEPETALTARETAAPEPETAVPETVVPETVEPGVAPEPATPAPASPGPTDAEEVIVRRSGTYGATPTIPAPVDAMDDLDALARDPGF